MLSRLNQRAAQAVKEKEAEESRANRLWSETEKAARSAREEVLAKRRLVETPEEKEIGRGGKCLIPCIKETIVMPRS